MNAKLCRALSTSSLPLLDLHRRTIPVLLGLGLLLACMVLGVSGAAAEQAGLEAGFVRPPDSARAWVYWFWLDGNITKEGITADLEAMHQAGLGGALWMWGG